MAAGGQWYEIIVHLNYGMKLDTAPRDTADIPMRLIIGPAATDLVAGEIDLPHKSESQSAAIPVDPVPIQPDGMAIDHPRQRRFAGLRIALCAYSALSAPVQFRRIDADEAHALFTTSKRVAIGCDARNRRGRKGD